jgi:hypothetical protein
MSFRHLPAIFAHRAALAISTLLLCAAGDARPPAPPSKPPQVKVASAEPSTETWAGHEILIGRVDLPLLGRIDTRTDNFVIATVTREGETYKLVQSACGSHTKPVLGSSVTLRDSAFSLLPATTIEYRRSGTTLVAPRWTSGWGSEDVDGDGHPGVTYDVNAPLCGGQIYASVHNVAMARAREGEQGRIAGEVKVRATQNVLGTNGTCLDMFAGDRKEELRGTFAYVPVPAGATCDSLAGAWPAQAPDPGARQK